MEERLLKHDWTPQCLDYPLPVEANSFRTRGEGVTEATGRDQLFRVAEQLLRVIRPGPFKAVQSERHLGQAVRSATPCVSNVPPFPLK